MQKLLYPLFFFNCWMFFQLNGQAFETDRLAKSANDIYVTEVGRSLTLLGDTNATTHSWDFDGGTGNTSAQQPTVSWNSPGQKTIIYSNGTTTDTIRSMIRVYPDLSQPDYTFDLGTIINGQIKLDQVPAGSVIHFTGTFNDWKLYIKNGTGTAANPIYITNGDSIVDINATNPHGHGILFIDNEHVVFAGNHHPNSKYGFRVNGSGIATVKAHSHLEISGVEILNSTKHGMLLKDDGFDRTSDEFSHFKIHNNRVENCALEGFYIGRYTYYWGGERAAFANAPYCHTFKALEVYRNEMVNCNWDGIQLGAADSAAYVHDNYIVGSGTAGLNWQSFGLVLSSGFKGEAFNNFVKEENGFGGGVQIYPYSNTRFYRNTIYAPSRLAIFMRTEPNYIPSDSIAYEHTDPTMHVQITDNHITSGEEALYILDNTKTPLGFTPNTIVPIEELTYTGNTIDAAVEFLYNGDQSNYTISNTIISTSLNLMGTGGSLLTASIITEEEGESGDSQNQREPSILWDASLEHSGYMDGPPVEGLYDPHVEEVVDEPKKKKQKKRLRKNKKKKKKRKVKKLKRK